MIHQSVLLPEVLKSFDLPKRRIIIDATLGLGGHTEALLTSPDFKGKVIGIDQDQSHLDFARKRLAVFGERFQGVHMNFGNLEKYLESSELVYDGILFDLGVASPHFDDASRGFSYQSEGPLDMRMDRTSALTAEEVVNTYAVGELIRIFSEYGEETLSKKIAERIVRERSLHRITTTTQLKELIIDVYRSAGFYSSKKNPATKVFQALRIEVNDEMKVLDQALRTVLNTIQPEGRILVISYHSLEDRMVKQFFKSSENRCICPPKLPVCTCGRKPLLRQLSKKALIPSEQEIAQNPRARSAKMRVAEKL